MSWSCIVCGTSRTGGDAAHFCLFYRCHSVKSIQFKLISLFVISEKDLIYFAADVAPKPLYIVQL